MFFAFVVAVCLAAAFVQARALEIVPDLKRLHALTLLPVPADVPADIPASQSLRRLGAGSASTFLQMRYYTDSACSTLYQSSVQVFGLCYIVYSGTPAVAGSTSYI